VALQWDSMQAHIVRTQYMPCRLQPRDLCSGALGESEMMRQMSALGVAASQWP
jgi:hypothetical protein